MNYFNFLETKFVERQKALAVSPESVTVENQAKFNAVMANIYVGRRIVQYGYQVYLFMYWASIKLHLVKPPVFLSSIPKETAKPELSVVPSTPPTPPSAA